MNSYVLFVGGVADGQRREVSKYMPTYLFHSLHSIFRTPILGEDITKESAVIDQHTYMHTGLRTGNMVVFVHEDLIKENHRMDLNRIVVEHLIQGYRNPQVI